MNKKKHVILDHPILGYFLLIVFCYIINTLFSFIDKMIAGVLPGYGQEMDFVGNKVVVANGVGTAIGSLCSVLFFFIWFRGFRGEYKGILKKKGLLVGLLMVAPLLVIHFTGSIVCMLSVGTTSVFLAFLKSSAPGLSEEVIFRGLGVANYMRRAKEEKQIWIIFWLSSILFGAIHLFNIFAGGNPITVVLQSLYAMGIGMLLATAYLRTGNLWPAIIAHWSIDFVEFIRKDLGEASGIMKGMLLGDWINIVGGILAGVLALVLMNKKHLPEIMEIWKDKWSETNTNDARQ